MVTERESHACTPLIYTSKSEAHPGGTALPCQGLALLQGANCSIDACCSFGFRSFDGSMFAGVSVALPGFR